LEEDRLLLELKEQGLSHHEIGRRLAERLNRSPGAVRTRLQKLVKRGAYEEAVTPKPAEKPRATVPLEDRVTAPLDRSHLTSLLEASLHLAEDPQHLPAIRVLLSQAVQLLQGQAVEAANTG
jgi:DNA-binding MarR family transcriptional regulator